jgi:hypothetical protein
MWRGGHFANITQTEVRMLQMHHDTDQKDDKSSGLLWAPEGTAVGSCGSQLFNQEKSTSVLSL